jgi:p-hydroxybenzoate 3-monooxygenase
VQDVPLELPQRHGQVMDTQVAIVGAGPAGLLLAHLLALRGIESVVLEARDRAYVEARVRAGVLEQGTVDLLSEAGVADRLHEEGLVHRGLELRFDGQGHRIDLSELTGGRAITVYGQQEVVKDLIAARLDAGGELLFEVDDVTLHDLEGETPMVRFRHEGSEHELRCAVVAGCDGFHGVCRDAIPAGTLSVFEREYPFAWLGILAEVAPSSEELIYCYHERGFALHSMRSPRLTRLYLQCAPDDDVAEWPDERIWDELRTRLATDAPWTLGQGPIVEKGITPMRSFVAEPLRYGRLFLAGDAAHIVPPTGAKGLNLAVADVRVLSEALGSWFADGDSAGLEAYSDACLRRVWRVQHFSWWMTSMLHRFPGDDPFDERLQRSQLRYVCSSRAAATTLAENYVGLEVV